MSEAISLPAIVGLAALVLQAAAADQAVPAARPGLLFFRNDKGETRPVTTVADWQQRRRAILAAMQQVMGPLPDGKRCPLDPQTAGETDCGTYIRRELTYASEPGSRTSAFLLIPKKQLATGAEPAPAVLCLHPTNAAGYKTVVGLAGPESRHYGAELAERGFVVLAPSYPLLGDYRPDLVKLGYVSGSMKAIWDNMRGLDLLESLPYVRRGSFGAIGHSLGGHNSVFTAAFDERLKAVVSSCGLDSFLDYMGGDITGWTSERYMPRLAAYRGRVREVPFDFDEVLAALAPRAVFLSAPRGDTNFRWQSVDRIAAAAREVFVLHGAADACVVEHPDCAHDFPDAMREKAYAFLARALSAKP